MNGRQTIQVNITRRALTRIATTVIAAAVAGAIVVHTPDEPAAASPPDAPRQVVQLEDPDPLPAPESESESEDVEPATETPGEPGDLVSEDTPDDIEPTASTDATEPQVDDEVRPSRDEDAPASSNSPKDAPDEAPASQQQREPEPAERTRPSPATTTAPPAAPQPSRPAPKQEPAQSPPPAPDPAPTLEPEPAPSTPAPKPTPASQPPPAPSYKERAEGYLADAGCVDAQVVLFDDAPTWVKREMDGGAAVNLAEPQYVYLRPDAGEARLRYRMLHECAHIQQVGAYDGDLEALKSEMNRIYGVTGVLGVERNAECVALEVWHAPVKSTFADYQTNCTATSTRVRAMEAIAAGRRP